MADCYYMTYISQMWLFRASLVTMADCYYMTYISQMWLFEHPWLQWQIVII